LKKFSKYPSSIFEFWHFLLLTHNLRISVFGSKDAQMKNKGHFTFEFLILNNFYFMNNPSKIPLSTLKLQFFELLFSTQATKI